MCIVCEEFFVPSLDVIIEKIGCSEDVFLCIHYTVASVKWLPVPFWAVHPGIKNGAVGFYILGVIYMFVALAIVCDEFFIPSLDVIIEKIGCSEEVAGN